MVGHHDEKTFVLHRGCWSLQYEEGRWVLHKQRKCCRVRTILSTLPTLVVCRYNFSGCEYGQHCLFGDCHANTTVCVCEDDLCNDFLVRGNASTPAPQPMTTTNTTMDCWYGMRRDSNTTEEYQVTHNSKDDLQISRIPFSKSFTNITFKLAQMETCGPEETACMYLDGDNGFHIAGCYDYTYNDGQYKKPGCYQQGQVSERKSNGEM